MQPGERFPNDQAEVAFTEESVNWLIERVSSAERESVFDSIVGLFTAPDGKHRLSNQGKTNLVGLNTVEAARRTYRVIYRARTVSGVGLIEIVTIGLRRDGEVYSDAHDLVASGKLSESEQTQIWDALRFLDETKERFGLEEWDYMEEAAPEGMIKAVAGAGILDEHIARLLSKEELVAAMEAAYRTGQLDTDAALQAAMNRVASSAKPDRVFTSRKAPRCGVQMPISGKVCIRAEGHAGAHRSSR